MANTESFKGMSDDAFEAHLNTPNLEDSEETPSGSLSSSEETLDESPTNVEESPVLASEELTPEEEGTEDVPVDTEGEVPDEETDEDGEATETPETKDESAEPTSDLDELYKPFKASGREVSVKSVEEAKKLMSMGVDYVEKLQGFKVHRKTIKTLAEHKIDGERLNLLIDASNGNRDAINKLIQDHKIDTMDLGTEDSNYTPSDNSVSDAQVEMDEVIERIQSSPSFSATSDIVTNQWDEASKKVIFEAPQHLATLNEHVSNGTYERVMTEVTRARMFDTRLQGLSDIDAYQKVGMELQQAGAFNKEAPAKVSRKPKPQVSTNTDKKLRASPSKATPSKTASKKYDFAGMSDEAFEKLL